jgi:hypothetical protein
LVCFHYAEGSQVDQKSLQKLQDHCTVPFRHLRDQGTSKSVCPCIFPDYLIKMKRTTKVMKKIKTLSNKSIITSEFHSPLLHQFQQLTVSRRCPMVLDVPLIKASIIWLVFEDEFFFLESARELRENILRRR